MVILRRKFNFSCIWFAGWHHDNFLILVFGNNEYDSIMANWKLNWPWQPCLWFSNVHQGSICSFWTSIQKKFRIFRQWKDWSCRPFHEWIVSFKPWNCILAIFHVTYMKLLFWVVTAAFLSQCRSACVFIYCSDQRPNIFLNIFCVIFYLYTVLLMEYLTRAWYFKC